MQTVAGRIPAHIPKELVYDYDHYTAPETAHHPQILGLDDLQNKDPYMVDFNREISQHLLFSSGPHRCVGSRLARLEIRVFLEEWVRTFRVFGVKDNAEVLTAGGVVWRLIAVPLVWPVSP
jgi:hypothetical protein